MIVAKHGFERITFYLKLKYLAVWNALPFLHQNSSRCGLLCAKKYFDLYFFQVHISTQHERIIFVLIFSRDVLSVHVFTSVFFRINGAKSEKIIVHWEKSLNLASDLHNLGAFPTWLNHKWITWIKHKTSLNSLRGKYLPLFVQNLSKHV